MKVTVKEMRPRKSGAMTLGDLMRQTKFKSWQAAYRYLERDLNIDRHDPDVRISHASDTIVLWRYVP